MRQIITDIVRASCLNFKEINNYEKSSQFIPIGLVDSFPNLNYFEKTSIYIWYIPNDIISLQKSEIERWTVDSPTGCHLFMSERDVHTDLKNILFKEHNILIWSSDDLALWLGNALISGIVSLSDEKIYLNINHSEIKKNNDLNQILTLIPRIDINLWLKDNAYSDNRSNPMLLKCKLWEIKGDLINLNGDIDHKNWLIIEDPWCKLLYKLSDEKYLKNTPLLRALDPKNSDWKSKSHLLNSLPPLLDEKRQGQPKFSGALTRSMMLENWNFKKESAEIKSSSIYVPSWSLNTEGGVIIHGLTGQIITNQH